MKKFLPVILLFVVLGTNEDLFSQDQPARPAGGQYTRRLTMAWAIFLAAVTVEVVLLAVLVDLKTWSWYANVFNPLAALTFFFAEYPYRLWRYSQFGPFSLKRSIRVILQRDAWITE